MTNAVIWGNAYCIDEAVLDKNWDWFELSDSQVALALKTWIAVDILGNQLPCHIITVETLDYFQEDAKDPSVLLVGQCSADFDYHVL